MPNTNQTPTATITLDWCDRTAACECDSCYERAVADVRRLEKRLRLARIEGAPGIATIRRELRAARLVVEA